MKTRTLLLWGGGVALAAGVVALVDALIVTDEERLEDFSRDVTGRIDHDRVERALAHTDPARVPIDLVVGGRTYHFDTENKSDLSALAHERLGPYDGVNLTLLQRTIDIKGDTARVMTDTLSFRGRSNVEYELRKREGTWIVSEVRVR